MSSTSFFLIIAVLGSTFLFAEALCQAVLSKSYGWFLPKQCTYCKARYKTLETATNCCLTNVPKRIWTRSHKPTSDGDLWKYAIVLFGLSVAAVAFSPSILNFFLAASVSGFIYYSLWKSAKREATCMECGVLADYFRSPKILCSRCYAKLDYEEKKGNWEEKPIDAESTTAVSD